MTMSIAAGAKPAFLSPNYFNKFADRGADLTLTSGSTLRHRLYDNEPRAQHSSAGSSDATPEVTTFGLWKPGLRASHDVDYWAVLNHNLTSLKVERSNTNGVSYATELDDAAIGATVYDSRGVLSATTACDKFKVTARTTKTANQEKLIGAIYVAKLRFQTIRMPLKYHVLPQLVGNKTAVMADGSLRWAPKFRSDASFRTYRAELAFLVDDSTELEDFRDLANDHEPFLFMPRPGDVARDMWLCRIEPDTFNDAPLVRSQQDARRVEFTIREVGA